MTNDTVAAVPLETKSLEDTLITAVVEGWKFSRLFNRALSKLDAGDAARYVGQIRFYLKRLEESLGAAGLTLVNLEGQVYDVGTAATALNIGDLPGDGTLVVHQMVEPIIMGPEGLRRSGVVMLRRADV